MEWISLSSFLKSKNDRFSEMVSAMVTATVTAHIVGYIVALHMIGRHHIMWRSGFMHQREPCIENNAKFGDSHGDSPYRELCQYMRAIKWR